MVKALFIFLALVGIVALTWHVGFLSLTVFTVAGSSVSVGLIALLVVFFLGIIYLKSK